MDSLKLNDESELQFKYFKAFVSCGKERDDLTNVANAIKELYDKKISPKTLKDYRKKFDWDKRVIKFEYQELRNLKEGFLKKQMQKIMESIEKSDELLEQLDKDLEDEAITTVAYIRAKNSLLLAKNRDLNLLNQL